RALVSIPHARGARRTRRTMKRRGGVARDGKGECQSERGRGSASDRERTSILGVIRCAILGLVQGLVGGRSQILSYRTLTVALGLFALVVGAIAEHATGQSRSAPGTGFTKSVEVDRSTYFRLKVKLAYKGEPQDFDIVVGCNVRQTNYKDGGRTVEVGLVPTVF